MIDLAKEILVRIGEDSLAALRGEVVEMQTERERIEVIDDTAATTAASDEYRAALAERARLQKINADNEILRARLEAWKPATREDETIKADMITDLIDADVPDAPKQKTAAEWKARQLQLADVVIAANEHDYSEALALNTRAKALIDSTKISQVVVE